MYNSTLHGNEVQIKKLCVITGASSGIGFNALKVFHANNWRCIAISRNKDKQMECFKDMPDVYPVACDISNVLEVKSTFSMIYEKYGNIDCLINSAGIGLIKGISNIDYEQLDNVLKVNLQGTAMCIKEALQYMKEGSIVNIGSKAGKKGNKNSLAYCASKFGLVGISESIALDLVNTGIRIYLINPGLTDTPMSRELFPDSASKAIPAHEVADIAFIAATKLSHIKYGCFDMLGNVDLKG